MPLDKSIYGTDCHGAHIEDYCVYCYQDGRFTEDVTMDEMIRLCARFVEGNSRDLAIANMKLQYPRLGRWARREDTQHEYYKSINRVLEYVQEHLHENPGLKTLAGIACISPFHFHRIFKATIGESLAEYVQRLRLEYVAERLKTSALSLSELAVRTAYSSEQALSRAFKNYFGLPPKAFKKLFFEEKFSEALTPRICKVAGRNIIRLREETPDGRSWQKLTMYAVMNRLICPPVESLEVIDAGVFRPALTVKGEVPENRHVEFKALADGLYAIFTHQGEVGKLPELYEAVLNYWLPASKYHLSTDDSYVVYLNHMMEVPPEGQLAELYIPLSDI